MPNVVSTTGVVSKFTTDALMGLGATATDPNGRFYLDGTMVNVELSRVIAESIYIQEIFRDGQSVTGKYTTNATRGGAVRVMLETPLPFGSRTTSFGGRSGTEGNAGIINTNAPLLPADDEFVVYLNQVNDQMMIFPDLSKEYIPMDVMSKKISSYSSRVAMDRSASTLAEIIGYAYFRAMNDGDNLFAVSDLNAENAYAELINKVHSALDNGDRVRGAFAFPTEGRTIIGRPSFINNLFSRKSGVIMLGGDMAQEMLKNYDLNERMSDRNYVGTGYKGYAMGFHYQSAPDYIWSLAEKYLGLPAGALDNVDAIAVSFDATAKATGIDLGVKVIDCPNPRGSLAQPLNIWGHEAFRKSFVIGDETLTTTYLSTTLSLTESSRLRPCAPAKANEGENQSDVIAVPVYAEDNVTIVGYRQVAAVPRPNGGNVRSGLPHVLPVKISIQGKSMTLSTETDGASIYYTTDGSDPTISSEKYSSAVTLSASVTVKAIATKAGYVPSVVETATYTAAQ